MKLLLLALVATFLVPSASATKCYGLFPGNKLEDDCPADKPYCFFSGEGLHLNDTVIRGCAKVEECPVSSPIFMNCNHRVLKIHSYEQKTTNKGKSFSGCCSEDLCNKDAETLQTNVNKRPPTTQTTPAPSSSSPTPTTIATEVTEVTDANNGAMLSAATLLVVWVPLVKVLM
uniref:Activin_recp domain-containing protein n=1 Tax=Steinernema glaseri TaxID=37863 RepID=A0A1I7ZF94_9BILA